MREPRVVEYTDSIGNLLRGILADVRELMREELALARAELREQAGRAKLAAFSLGVAALALGLGAVFLLVAAAIGIADLMNWPAWAGYLTVAVLLCGGGAATFAAGRRRLQGVHPVPQQTIQTLKENSEWIAKRLSSDRK